MIFDCHQINCSFSDSIRASDLSSSVEGRLRNCLRPVAMGRAVLIPYTFVSLSHQSFKLMGPV